jgi:polyphosphate kinase
MENRREPKHFLNRELSWLEFNQRVLDEAGDASNPLLERLKFFTIVSSNLDEFFEVRVAGLKQQIESGNTTRSVDGLTPAEIFTAITRRVRQMVVDKYRCWQKEIQPALAANKIRLLEIDQLEAADLGWLREFYQGKVRPVLTPLAIDPAHPFPQLLNKSLNLIVRLEMAQNGASPSHLAVVQCPSILPRLIQLPREDGSARLRFLGQLIGHFLADLFPGTEILGYWAFRLTRNSELYVDEGDTPNLLKAVEEELHKRRRGHAVRLEIAHDCPQAHPGGPAGDAASHGAGFVSGGRPAESHPADDVVSGEPLAGAARPAVCGPGLPGAGGQDGHLRRDPRAGHPAASSLRKFSSVVEFLETAATDYDTLAIKMTLYRTGGDPRIVGALMNAVNNGKQVTAVVELRARFDEANNIEWARKLEENGVHVVYGLVGYKIHAKMTLVVRREGRKSAAMSIWARAITIRPPRSCTRISAC